MPKYGRGRAAKAQRGTGRSSYALVPEDAELYLDGKELLTYQQKSASPEKKSSRKELSRLRDLAAKRAMMEREQEVSQYSKPWLRRRALEAGNLINPATELEGEVYGDVDFGFIRGRGARRFL